MSAADYQHNCTLSYVRRDFLGNRTEETLHLIGTEAEIADHISRAVVSGLRDGSGPYVFTPVPPHSVIRLSDR